MATFDTLIRLDTLTFWSSAGSEPTRIILEVKIQHVNKRRKARKGSQSIRSHQLL